MFPQEGNACFRETQCDNRGKTLRQAISQIKRHRSGAVQLMLQIIVLMKLKLGFTNYSNDQLADLGDTVATNLPTSPICAALTTTPAQITAATKALRDAMNMTGPGRAAGLQAAFHALADLLSQARAEYSQLRPATPRQSRDHFSSIYARVSANLP